MIRDGDSALFANHTGRPWYDHHRKGGRDAIDAALDTDAFNTELDTEKRDAAYLQTVREKTHAMLGDIAGDEPE